MRYQTRIIRIRYINVSYWYQSLDTSMFIAYWSAFHQINFYVESAMQRWSFYIRDFKQTTKATAARNKTKRLMSRTMAVHERYQTTSSRFLFLKSSARGTQNMLCKLGKETSRRPRFSQLASRSHVPVISSPPEKELSNFQRAWKRNRLLAVQCVINFCTFLSSPLPNNNVK